jgi:hypothetical protein
MKTRFFVLICLFGVAADEGGEVELNATARRDDTRIRFLIEGNTTIIDIASGFGIDRAAIAREADHWPRSVVVRLHLRGLESFQATAEDVTVEWSVSAAGDRPARVTLRRGSEETPLDETSPYFTKASVVGGRGTARRDGYFEVPLPSQLFEANPKKVSLAWVDFYRQ